MSFEVHVLEPTRLAPAGREPREVFLRVWSRARFVDGARNARAWRGSWLLDEEGGLFLKGLRTPLGRSAGQRVARAFRLVGEVRSLLALRDRGLRVPAVLAWGVERRGGVPARSFLLERALAGAVDLERYVSLTAGSGADRSAVFRAVGAEVGKLHASDFYHRDLACRNVLLRPADAPHEIFFVDCPRGERGRALRRGYLRRKDLLLLASDALRRGASPDEVRALLRAADRARASRTLRFAERAFAAEPGRSARARVFSWLGV